MTIRLLLVFLLFTGAGTLVGQQGLLPPAAGQTLDAPSDLPPAGPDEPEGAEVPEEPGEPVEPAFEAPMDEVDQDEAAIARAIDSFVDAFNRGDAKTLAAHWTEHGDFVTASGQRWQGREEIAERYAAYFAEAVGVALELHDTRVEMQSPSVAVETGIARVVAPGEVSAESEYKAIHVKTAAGWKIDSVRETEIPQSPERDRLMQLDWMVGQWTDRDEQAEITTTSRWATNRSFLVQTFRVFIEDKIDFEGSQIIGWDPLAKAIRSWTFDSDGGFGVGRWSNEDGRWTVQTLYVLPDGRTGSATNIYQQVDNDTVVYRSVGRQVDGKILPSIDPITVVRVQQE